MPVKQVNSLIKKLLQSTDKDDILKNAMFGLVKAYTINKIDDKYKKNLSEESIKKIISDIVSLLSKDSVHITKNKEYFEELFLYFFELHKQDLLIMNETTSKIYMDIENNLLTDINKLNTITSEINHKTKEGNTLLSIACSKNNIELVKKIISLGADLNIICIDRTALDISIKNKNKELVSFLLSKGAFTFLKMNNDYLKILEGKKIEINKKKESICSCCTTWTSNNMTSENITIMKKFYDNKFIDVSDKEFENIIPEINHKSTNGWTFLYIACDHGKFELVKKLIENGAEINLSCNNYSPLFVAVLKDNKDIVRLLIEKGANVNFISKTGHEIFVDKSVLHLALLQGKTDICKLLIDNGADFRQKYKNETCLELCNNLGLKEIIIHILKSFETTIEEKKNIVANIIKDNTENIKDKIISEKKYNKKIFDNMKIIIEFDNSQIISMLKNEDILIDNIKNLYYKLYDEDNCQTIKIKSIAEKEFRLKAEEDTRLKVEQVRLKAEQVRLKAEQVRLKTEQEAKEQSRIKTEEEEQSRIKTEEEEQLKAIVDVEKFKAKEENFKNLLVEYIALYPNFDTNTIKNAAKNIDDSSKESLYYEMFNFDYYVDNKIKEGLYNLLY